MAKRAVDTFVSTFALAVTAPLQVVIGLVVAKSMGRPVLFRQERPGLRGVPFEMVKFRTMTDQRDEDGVLLDDALRHHRVGHLLRRSSLDELPTFLNVLRGEMSLVGPRPLVMEYMPRYSPEQARRHEVKPGMTGLAQVKGRNTVAWEDRFALDVDYVDGWSLRLDARIVVGTVATLVRGLLGAGGADALGVEAPGEFMGSASRSVEVSRSVEMGGSWAH